MKIFLLRHGTRNFTTGDVPLNSEGLIQAQELSKDQELLTAKTILCSPKKRAQMTIEPIATTLALKIKTIETLDQMRSGESESAFLQRVSLFFEEIHTHSWPSPIIICSHSDWLSAAVNTIPTNEIDLNYHMFHCAQYLCFEFQNELWIKK